MSNANFGIYDYDSIGGSPERKTKRIIGAEHKICKSPDLHFKDISTTTKSYGYIPKYKGATTDNCRDIFVFINELKKDIRRYKKIGIETITYVNGQQVVHNWNKYANNCLREIDRLNNLL